MYIKIQDDYLDYLKKNADSRIPNYQYGSKRYKPFFIIAQINPNIIYVANVTSPKPRHKTLKNSIDFKKYFLHLQVIILELLI